MKLSKLIYTFVLILFVSQHAYAGGVKVVGTLSQTFKQLNSNQLSSDDTPSEKTIRLLQIELSDAEREQLKRRAQDALNGKNQFSMTASSAEGSLPSKYQVGMNNVPILDQGIHGTCSTFAVTVAIDAALGKGDYISQVCSLQLGRYLEKHGYGASGWNGAYTINTFKRIEQYGIVNKDKQRKLGCGGLKKYPTYFVPDEHLMMEPADFNAKSELVLGKSVNWEDVYETNDPNKTLMNVKEALQRGDRVVLSFVIPHPSYGTVGAVGRYKTWFYPDTWMLTSRILKDVEKANAAHALVITGYDDNAVVHNGFSQKNTGVLTLRNSWGSVAGNWGTFYMTYDYFKLLAFGTRRVSTQL